MLEARGIGKSYGTVRANDGISFGIESGEIVGLVGENGAGKSTLLSILAGFVAPDEGEIIVDGVPRSFGSPRDALAAGVGLVHQHLSLVPTFTVREQLRLAGWDEPTLPPILGSDVHEDAVIERLSPGQQQRLEIARVLARDPGVLLLDEPTSILAPSDLTTLFLALEAVRRQGTAVVIVSHKLHEVMGVADRIVVLAGGKVTGAFARCDGSWEAGVEREILHCMFGPGASPAQPEAMRRSGVVQALADAPLLVATGIATAHTAGARTLHGVDLDLWPGVIHAIVGIDGQGQAELAEALAGYRPHAGQIMLEGVRIEALDAPARASAGVAMIAGDRFGEAAINSFTIAENVVLKRPRRTELKVRGMFRGAAVRDVARRLIEEWDVHPADPDALFSTLSGGNMQRVIVAREIARQPRVLIAINPVQGLDVRTADFLWAQLRALCAGGGTVLAFVSDLDEALARADRIAVMIAGTISGMNPAAQSNRSAIAAMMVSG